MVRKHWTNEDCIEIAKQYINVTNFQRAWPGCYKYAVKHGLLEQFVWFERKRVKRNYWTYENCYKEAQKYKTMTEFRKQGGTAYNKACINGWLQDYVWLKYTKKKNGYWSSYENCLNAAKKCHSRHEFSDLTTNGYLNSIKNGWIEDFVWLNEKQIKDYDELKNFVYITYAYIDEPNKTIYIGLTNNIKQRHQRHNRFDKRRQKYSSVKEYFLSIGDELPQPTILEENLNVVEAQKEENFWVEYYKSNDWKVLNKAKTGIGSSSVGGGFIKWTYDRCYEVAQECKCISELKDKYYGAYRNASNFGWLNDYFWFIKFSKPRNYWNYEHCKEESKKYKSRSEFAEKCIGAYRASRLNKWLDDFFPKK